jgi:hypothetical protein
MAEICNGAAERVSCRLQYVQEIDVMYRYRDRKIYILVYGMIAFAVLFLITSGATFRDFRIVIPRSVPPTSIAFGLAAAGS